jgi:hypothetical protein
VCWFTVQGQTTVVCPGLRVFSDGLRFLSLNRASMAVSIVNVVPNSLPVGASLSFTVDGREENQVWQ